MRSPIPSHLRPGGWTPDGKSRPPPFRCTTPNERGPSSSIPRPERPSRSRSGSAAYRTTGSGSSGHMISGDPGALCVMPLSGGSCDPIADAGFTPESSTLPGCSGHPTTAGSSRTRRTKRLGPPRPRGRPAITPVWSERGVESWQRGRRDRAARQSTEDILRNRRELATDGLTRAQEVPRTKSDPLRRRAHPGRRFHDREDSDRWTRCRIRVSHERLGGAFAIAAVVDHFSNALIKDPVVGQRSSNPALRKWHRNDLEPVARSQGHAEPVVVQRRARTPPVHGDTARTNGARARGGPPRPPHLTRGVRRGRRRARPLMDAAKVPDVRWRG